MPINNKSVAALIVSGVLLLSAAVVVYALQYGVFTSKAPVERKNHTEVRVALGQAATNSSSN